MHDGTVLRYAIDDKRNMYAWDAIDGTHSDIEIYLNEIDEDTITVDHGYIDANGEKVRSYDPSVYR